MSQIEPMTRINVVDPRLLSDKHLGAAYRELPRVFGLVKAHVEKGNTPEMLDIPPNFTLGEGHVTFFYDKLGWVVRRYEQICDECRRRGRVVNYGDIDSLIEGIPLCWMNDWVVTPEAIILNLERILIRRKEGPLHRLHYENLIEDWLL